MFSNKVIKKKKTLSKNGKIKVIILKGKTIKEIKGTNSILKNTLAKLILKKLRVSIGIEDKKEIKDITASFLI